LGQEARVKVALVGRPNVGKSTLTNRLLKEERVVVMDEPGTTRDSVYIPMSHLAQPYLLIDTAGMRRRSRVHEVIEKFSTIKAKQAMGQADAVILILDAQLGLVDQDLKLLGDIIDAGKALVVALNKWDGLDAEQKDSIKKELKWKLQFAPFAKIKFISALHGTGVGELLPLVREAYNAAHQSFSASMLTSLLEKAVTAHPPPMVHGRRIKLRYAHSGGQNPPKIIIHGNQTSALSRDYKKYINNFYRKALGLTGTPIQIIYRTGTNPYQGKKNTLTSRQVVKKQRLMRFVKKKK
jgi:GTP-binding protein